MVYKLLGTKQAGRCWYLHVTKTLRELNLQQATKDSCFFIQRDATGTPNLMISVLVDDLLIMGASEKLVMAFHKRFSMAYKVSQFEKVKVYNGIHISRTGTHAYSLSQEYSISQFLAKCPIKDDALFELFSQLRSLGNTYRLFPLLVFRQRGRVGQK